MACMFCGYHGFHAGPVQQFTGAESRPHPADAGVRRAAAVSLSYFENRSTGEIMTRVTKGYRACRAIFVDGLEGLLTASLTLVGSR